MEAIRDDEYYAIVSIEESGCYPATCQEMQEGEKGHLDLQRDLQNHEVRGRLVAVGPCPFCGDESWIATSPDVLRFTLTATQP